MINAYFLCFISFFILCVVKMYLALHSAMLIELRFAYSSTFCRKCRKSVILLLREVYTETPRDRAVVLQIFAPRGPWKLVPNRYGPQSSQESLTKFRITLHASISTMTLNEISLT